MKTLASQVPGEDSVEDTILKNAKTRPDKLQRIAMSYDLAHLKAKLEDEAFEKEKRRKIEVFEKRRLVGKTKRQMLRVKKRRKHVENKKKRRMAKKLARANRESAEEAKNLNEKIGAIQPTSNKEINPQTTPESDHSISTRSKSKKQAVQSSDQMEPKTTKPALNDQNKKHTANSRKRRTMPSHPSTKADKEETAKRQTQTPTSSSVPPPNLPPPDSDTDSNISDISTDDSLELLSKIKRSSKHKPPAAAPESQPEPEPPNPVFDNPWNANITVSLKVFVKEGDVEMRVVREEFVPIEEEEEVGSESDGDFGAVVGEMMGVEERVGRGK